MAVLWDKQARVRWISPGCQTALPGTLRRLREFGHLDDVTRFTEWVKCPVGPIVVRKFGENGQHCRGEYVVRVVGIEVPGDLVLTIGRIIKLPCGRTPGEPWWKPLCGVRCHGWEHP